MNIGNRIIKYLEETPIAQCFVISDTIRDRVILSFSGEKIIWEWKDNGLVCPGSSTPIDIHPLGAQALITEEIISFLRLEGLPIEEVSFIIHSGEEVSGIIMHPGEIDNDYDTILKKEKITELFEKLTSEDDKLSKEIIGEAIAFDVLEPFLSLVNL